MKKRAQRKVSVKVEVWQTDLSGFERIWFQGMIGIEGTHFLLGTPKGTYRLSLPARAPYRIVDESYLQSMHRHFPRREKSEPYTPTWKIWGSRMVQELEATAFFEGVAKDKHFSYFVATEDECIEFITAHPVIEFLASKDIAEISRELLEKELKQRKGT